MKTRNVIMFILLLCICTQVAMTSKVANDTLVGQWDAVSYNGKKTEDDKLNTTFNADGTGSFGPKDAFTWSYDAESKVCQITDDGYTFSVKVTFADGLLTLETLKDQVVTFTLVLRRKADSND